MYSVLYREGPSREVHCIYTVLIILDFACYSLNLLPDLSIISLKLLPNSSLAHALILQTFPGGVCCRPQ